MHPERPLTPGERHFLTVFLGALPAIIIGFYVGVFASGIGTPRELASILIRALVCTAPAAALAVLAPRSWLLPSLIYGYSFYSGYILFDGFGADIATVFLAPFAALIGERIGSPAHPTHPELLWLFIIALWLAALISFLRRHDSRPSECANRSSDP